MLKVENINTILISYSTISKCNPKLVGSLNKVFKPVLNSQNNNENLKKLAFQYAPIAMKIFNQIIKTLSDIDRDQSNDKKRKLNFIDLSDDSSTNQNKKQKCNTMQHKKRKLDDVIIIDEESKNYTSEKKSLIESSKITLEVLERLETYLNIKPIDIDLAHSNLITKLIDVQMYEPAEVQLKHLYERIKSRYLENEMNDIYKDIIQLHKDIITIPIINNDEDLSKISQLVVVTQLNSIKCLSYRNKLDFLFNERNNTLYKWCEFVEEKNKLLSEKLYSNVCRVFLKSLSEKYNDKNPEIAFKIQLMALEAMSKTSGFNITWYIDAVLKYAYTYDQKMKNESNLKPVINKISIFYDKAFRYITDENLIQLNLSKKLITLLDHYLYLGKKIKSPTIVINSRKLLFRSLNILKENNKIPDYVYYTTKLIAYFDIIQLLYYDLFINIEKSKFYDQSFQYVDQQLNFIESIKDIILSLDYIPAIKNDNTLSIINSVETFIKIIDQNIYLFNSKQTSGLLIKQRKSLISLFETIINLFNVFLSKKWNRKENDLVTIIIRCQTLLSNLSFIFEDYNTWLCIDNYLEAAKELADKYSSINGFKEISKAYSNIAIKLFKNKYYKESISLFDFSYKTLLKVTDRSLELANTLDMLAICHYYIHEKENAKKSLIESFIRIPLEEYQKFNPLNSESTNSIINKIIEHYVRFSISTVDAKHPYLYLDDILAKYPCEKNELEGFILNVMNYELQLFKALEDKHNTEIEQFKLIDHLLKYYDENLYPFSCSKLKLKKLNLFQILKPRDLEDHLNLCHSIIDLLKKEDYKNDEDKKNQRNNYLSLAYSIYGTIINQSNNKQIKYFKTALKTWHKLFSSLMKYKNDKGIINNYIDNTEQIYSYIAYLADYFNIFGNYKYRIFTLRVLLEFNELLNEDKKYSDDKIKIRLDISSTYLKMGYSKLALEELSSLESSMISSSHYSWLCYHLYLSYYYITNDELEKCKVLFNQISSYVENNQLMEKFDDFSSRLNSIVLSFAYYVLSMINIKEGNLCLAVRVLLYELSIINNYIILHSHKKFVLMDSKDSNSPYRYLIQTSQWKIMIHLLQCYKLLGNVYSVRGSICESSCYYKEGLQLSELIQSDIYLCQFHSDYGYLEFKRNNIEESDKYYNKAILNINTIKNNILYIEYVQLEINICLSYVERKKYNQALNLINKLQKYINIMINEDYIKSIEQISNNLEIKHIKNSIKSDSMNEMAKNYYSIFKFNNHILLQQALIYKNLNIQEKAKNININQLIPITADECLIYVNILLSEFIHTITLNPNMDFIFESASSLLISDPNKICTINNNDNNLNLNMHQLNLIEKCLKKSLLLSYRKDIPEVFRKASLYSLYITVIKSFLLPYQSLIISESIINKCAYLLEISKGLTYRRELFEIYTNKLTKDSNKKEEKISQCLWPDKKLNQDLNSIKQQGSKALKNNDINYILYIKYLQEDHFGFNTFQEDYINIIPDQWTVCSITFDHDRHCFYFCRYHSNRRPLIFHIPIKRHISHKKTTTTSNPFFEFEKGVSYLRNLLYKENNNSEMTQYSGYTEDEKINNISSEEKANWWNERIDLDRHLEELLIKMEVQWIGGFKGIFCPVIKGYEKERLQFRKELENFIGGIVLKLDSESYLEFDQEVCDCFLHLKEDVLDSELEDVIHYFLDYYQGYGIVVDYNKIDLDMHVRILRKILQKYRDLNLYDFDEHIIIIPDKVTEIIPWENLPILHDKPTSRMLSLSLLRDRILLMNNEYEHRIAKLKLTNSSNNNNTNKKQFMITYKDKYIIDTRSTYYILNPGGDLMNTQNKFQHQFENQSQWLGISGKAPTEKEYMNGLSNYQLFMYFGHGGGECYIKGRTIRNHMQKKCAVTLLMGCSSGLLKSSGDYDPTGNSINYILGLSPALTANLWDVTDRDIDRLTQGLLEEWGVLTSSSSSSASSSAVDDSHSSPYYKIDLLLSNSAGDNDGNLSLERKNGRKAQFVSKHTEFSLSLSQALVLARRRCKLKFLIGASTVIYGIPIYIFHQSN